MRAWWAGLSTREQAFIALAAAIFVLFFFMQTIVGPIAGWKSAAADRAEQAANGYNLVARAATTAAPDARNADSETPARNALIDTARGLRVDLTFVNEHADGSIEFQAGPVAPEAAFALFAALERDFGVRIVAADIARSPDAPTDVRVQATLGR